MARTHHQEKIIYQINHEEEYIVREEWLHTGNYSDCVFIVGAADPSREVIRAHRQILMVSGSKRLSTLLKTYQGEDPILIPDVEPKIFHLLLSSIYLHRFELTDSATAFSLAKAAKDYGLDCTAKKCMDYIKSPENLNANNVIETYELAIEKDGEQSSGE